MKVVKIVKKKMENGLNGILDNILVLKKQMMVENYVILEMIVKEIIVYMMKLKILENVIIIKQEMDVFLKLIVKNN